MTATVPTFDLERLGPWGRTLTLAPPGEGQRALPATALLAGPTLEYVLGAYARDLGTDRLAVAASAWSKQHAKAVLPGPLAAWVVGAVGFDAAPQNTHIHLAGNDPVAMRLLDGDRATAGPPGRDRLVQGLFAEHLEPLYVRLHELSGLGLHVLWNNAGNLIAWLLDQFATTRPDNPRILPLRRALLEATEAAWTTRPNPLRDPVTYDTLDLPSGPKRIQVRQACCLRHALPGLGACTTCPLLSHDERQALVRSLEKTQ